ncbi:MAG TPA: tautomerase family protein [Myxococcales bacterium]|jgi:phenylpyruvate tautomerase PptA (4-oxalocrotonate tautomerase family)
MPFVRIELRKGRTAEQRRAISDAVHAAMVETINVPPLDKFQVVTEHEAGDFVYDASYLDIQRTDGLVMIQITLNVGRTVEARQALYKGLADKLENLGVRRQDLLVNLVETQKENWSFGNGIAQYAPKP